MPRVPIAALFLALLAMPSQSQEFQWPETPKNLQVLPKDFSGKRLQPIMFGFSSALGVRCAHCHVGEPGQPLSTYDFASDANPNKNRAREMYRMLGDINGHLKKIEPSSEPKVNMWCHTCHHGRPRPATLEEELTAAHRKGGVTAAIARYRELRAKYANKDAYDFSEDALNGYAYSLAKKDPDGAIAIARLNAVEYPASANPWDTLAELYLNAGKRELAEIYYRKSLELDPANENALKKLRELAAPAH